MRLRMADEDREKYGGPEWVDFGDVPAWLDSLGYDELVAVEDQIIAGLPPSKTGPEPTLLWILEALISFSREASAMPMVRIRLWLALRAAGVDVALADFRPARLYGMRVVQPGRDAVPPADESDSSPTSSPTPGEATQATTPASESFTAASIPGPGEPTA